MADTQPQATTTADSEQTAIATEAVNESQSEDVINEASVEDQQENTTAENNGEDAHGSAAAQGGLDRDVNSILANLNLIL